MTTDRAARSLLALSTMVLVGVALSLTEAVLAPIAFALFTIALAWPVQRAVQARAGAAVGMMVAMLASLVVVLALALATGWAFSRVGQWIAANASQLQTLWIQKLAWAEAQGLAGASSLGATLDLRWLLRLAQMISTQLQGILSFSVVALVFIMLGLLEVGIVGRQLLARGTPAALGVWRASIETARKLRAYMLVRSLMSLVTGLAVWAFARAVGLDLAVEWGVIAFVLNYIPFIGPLIATVFPTAFAALQFGDWQWALAVFVALQIIQFVIGSYVEPRVAGKRVALSPFMVLVAVFLGALVWGIPGAFIGVPILIAIVALCEQFEASRFAAQLLSGRETEAHTNGHLR
jgi:predicted PurR-regulated permease PerM